MRIGSSPSLLTDHRRESRGGRLPFDNAGGGSSRAPLSERLEKGLRELAALDSSGVVAPRNRGAMQAYLANVPSLGERMGIELAGIDLYV